MSHYTTISFQFSISKKNTKVIEILKCFDNWKGRPTKKLVLPKNKFFKHDDWDSLFSMGPNYQIFIKKDIGDRMFYHMQGDTPFDTIIVNDFASWISPYAKGVGDGAFIGWSIYESSTSPEIYFGEW